MTTTVPPTVASSLGKVAQCTLTGAQNIDVDGRTYCAINAGEKAQSEGISHCTKLNARLPLPKSDAEFTAFKQFSPDLTWIGITDPVRGRDQLSVIFCFNWSRKMRLHHVVELHNLWTISEGDFTSSFSLTG